MANFVEALNDCCSEQLCQLVKEHNKGVIFMEALKKALPGADLPELPKIIQVKGRD